MEYRSLEHMLLDVAEMIRPPERLTVSQAAEKYRYLNNEGTLRRAVGRTPNDPYLVEPMDDADQPRLHRRWCSSARRATGKSDMFDQLAVRTTAICDPADMMLST
jgi:phage terminase large subunit GpA-like protein